MSSGGELAFQKQIREVAKQLGWRIYRPSAARGSRLAIESRGFPDLTLVRRGRILFLELKADKGVLTPEQVAWLEDLGDVAALAPNIVARVVRPKDYDEIVRMLA